MNPIELVNAHCSTIGANLADVAAMARRDWAVRVLDAWADDHEHVKRSYEVRPTDGTVEARAVCVLRHRGIDSHFGNYDTCKLSAAEAVWPELPESVRAEIGERP